MTLLERAAELMLDAEIERQAHQIAHFQRTLRTACATQAGAPGPVPSQKGGDTPANPLGPDTFAAGPSFPGPGQVSGAADSAGQPHPFPRGPGASFQPPASGTPNSRDLAAPQRGRDDSPAPAPAPHIWLCAWCKRPYNALGQIVHVPTWRQPAQWSHGICPACLVQQLAEVPL